jgi:NADP-dependent 3-hydroxy acid dehydrogenase YdfG
MPFPYNKVLIIGATSGIGETETADADADADADPKTTLLSLTCCNSGRALAEAIVERSDAKVVVTGRREESLKELVEKYGKDRVSSATLDVTRLETIEGFLKT